MADLKRSPLAPAQFPTLLPVPGIELGAIAAGLRYKGRLDLMLARFAEGSRVAGVFTRSSMPAAPVDWSRRALKNRAGLMRGLVVNAGNANAFTGIRGQKAARRTAEYAASVLGCADDEVLLASTGVIGEGLTTGPIKKGLGRMMAGLSTKLYKDAANAIRTTDTFAKGAVRVTDIGGRPVTINGIAKGSGMIAPDMATMLAFLFTNANLTRDCLQTLLVRALDPSFHSITVDGDTSTNDTVLAITSGQDGSDTPISDPDDPALANFRTAFEAVMVDLARQVVRDGEGAQKFITIQVNGAESDAAARRVGLAVGNSPLVKTAVAGEDPNWGRLVMAVGKSGERADRDSLEIRIGDHLVAHKGSMYLRYDEAAAAAHMRERHVRFTLDLGMGDGRATVWTTDLTHGYIDINADYRS
ncbi:bifunctional glutamate N-acetyltransferase/amino-acid acetyltransferase ArgJ [Yunchengibacter salinarum]|uniref:bifunctional glutamate N-acetyltransferase/amino-acid acetyltransferase ArgJ n=1 Tax=Yunchengibacter salinarum TaxID=3133399 RepID=UPI0035B5E3FC